MKVHVIGGGPAGLYFAILMKKAWPQTRITVFERNQPDDTFGFGVVFSDQTLDTFESYDRESYRAIVGHFAYWDDIEIHFRGTTHRIGGNGFCGCSRSTLLKILRPPRALARRRAQVPDRRSRRSTPRSATPISWSRPTASTRASARRFADQFKPSVDLRPNNFAWMGSTRPFDAFTFFFSETEHGIFIAHCYQYEPGRSTWVMETDPRDVRARRPRRARRGGVGALPRRRVRRGAAGPQADHQPLALAQLPDHPLRALGRGQHRADRRRQGDRAFLDRLRHQARDGGRDRALRGVPRHRRPRRRQAALAHFETRRREEVEKTQHSADVSLVWFEHVKRFWDMDPTRFAFGLMTRSKAITYDNLALRAPEFVDEVDRVVARDVRALGFDGRDRKAAAPMFQPFRLRGMTLANRVVVSPMCQYSAEDGLPNDWHLVHFGSRAIGGAGLMFTEMTGVSADARITPGCTGIYERRAGGGLEAHRRFRARAIADEVLPAARPRRPQGRDQADVGGHGRAAGGGRLADHLGVAAALLPAQPGAARDDARRHGRGDRRFRRRRPSAPTAPAST